MILSNVLCVCVFVCLFVCLFVCSSHICALNINCESLVLFNSPKCSHSITTLISTYDSGEIFNVRTLALHLLQLFMSSKCCGWTHKKRIARCNVFQEHFPQMCRLE